MQKLLQRSSAAQRNAARRAARQASKRENDQEYSYRQSLRGLSASKGMYIKQERERRREAYETGPIAPRYDVGENTTDYATVDPHVLQGITRPWSMYKKDIFHIAEGDRVVIIRGKDKGKIGSVASLDEKAGHVKLEGLNMGDWFVPEFARVEGSDNRPVIAQPLPIPTTNVKLVHALRDPETGHFKDTILDNVIVKGAGWNKVTKEYKRGKRYVPGLVEPIPWPKAEDLPEQEPNDDDTYRINVDEMTHRPYLLQPPMPPSVIDELRNKYSVFRNRHEDWYEAKKLAEDRAEKQKKLHARIVSTPTAELKEKTRLERLANQSDLTAEQLAMIGEVMAKERLNAAKRVAQSQQ